MGLFRLAPFSFKESVMSNETKKIKTRVINGRVVLMGACWKWGPLFSNQQANKAVNQAPAN
jgi:hypothetical protein